MTLPIWTGAECFSALSVAAWALTRKRPEWRRLACALSALAVIDATRAVLAPYSQAMISPWWSLDVALFAAWPMVMAWGLSARHPSAEVSVEHGRGEEEIPIRGSGAHVAALPTRGSGETKRERAQVVHAPSLTTLAALGYVILLGAARPWLPACAHLAGQVAPRVVLAGVWVGAVWRMATGDKSKTPGSYPGASWRRPTSYGFRRRPGLPADIASAEDDGALNRGPESNPSARLPQLYALLLAGCDVAAAAVAWSPALRGVAPAWPVARGLTLAGYVACAVVMGWGWRRRG